MVRATELAIDNRFATAQQMAAALSGKAVAPAPSKRKPTKVLPPTRPLAPLRRPVPGWVRTAGGLAVLVLVVGIATLAVMLGRRPAPPPVKEAPTETWTATAEAKTVPPPSNTLTVTPDPTEVPS